MLTRGGHEILNAYYRREREAFKLNSRHLEHSQRRVLKKIMLGLKHATRWQGLEDFSYEALTTRINVGDYSQYSFDVERQRNTRLSVLTPNVTRFEPTSGSTGGRKWIPYSRAFLNEMNRAAAAWLGDLYFRHPEIKTGAHYWSLSWLPEELRAHMTSDDSQLFPLYQRLLLKQVLAVPAEIAYMKESKAAWYATMLHLCARRDLALVSVWSPTYWLRLTHDIKDHWPEISLAISSRKDLKGTLPTDPQAHDFFKKLWPNLKLISAWDSSSSTHWAEKLRAEFSHVGFQGKGLWATEGVVTIPFNGQNTLAYRSHFFEFREIRTGAIKPAWALERGDIYQPIIWSSTGLLRYQLADFVQVTSFMGEIPCLTFLGRDQTVDMVGEKIPAVWVRDLFAARPEWRALTLLARHQPRPRYQLLHQSELSIDIENELLKNHHYRVARELGQLEAAECIAVQNEKEYWHHSGRNSAHGYFKPEILQELNI